VNELYGTLILSLQKKHMQKMIPLLVCLLFATNCSKNDNVKTIFKEDFVDLGTHKLKTYLVETNSSYLIIFESGLGDDHSVWQTKNVAEDISKKMDVVIYDRGGYGKSTIDNNPRNIDRLRTEFESVIDKYANNRKVILVAHSIGGLIIRDYAIKNPNKIAALLFVDPSHEYYNRPTQDVEDLIFNAFANAYGSNFGGTREAKELIEDFAYTSSLPNLPNVPVVVLTSIKNDKANTTADQTYNKTRQDWYNAHELLKNGVTDFTHIQTTNSGHYIMNEEPNLIIDNLNFLIGKLP
jgi:pimeloyl-ACP methyl ester carboxylesterase